MPKALLKKHRNLVVGHGHGHKAMGLAFRAEAMWDLRWLWGGVGVRCWWATSMIDSVQLLDDCYLSWFKSLGFEVKGRKQQKKGWDYSQDVHLMFPWNKDHKNTVGGGFLPIICSSLLFRCFKVMKKGNSLPTLIAQMMMDFGLLQNHQLLHIILVVNADSFWVINSKNTNLPSNEVTNGGWKDVFAHRFFCC